jgi:plastocyanin
MVRVALAISLAVLTVACDRNSGESTYQTPVGPSATLATPADVSTGASVTTEGREDVLVNMHDACDSETFNAVLGPGTCVRAGGITFEHFITELTRLGSIGSWRFAPSAGSVRVGQTFVATNTGGEAHTFTEVAEFGGGVVPLLNELSHLPDVAPECTAIQPDDFVPSGGTYREAVDRTGSVKFQCCIHPWMQLEVSSR